MIIQINHTGHFFENIGSPTSATWAHRTNKYINIPWPYHPEFVDIDADGDFTITWNGNGAEPDPLNPGSNVLWKDRDTRGVFTRSYHASASGVAPSAVTVQTRVNTTDIGDQEYPTIGMEPDGDNIVVWSGRGVGDPQGIFARRYDESTDTLFDNASGEPCVPDEGNFVCADGARIDPGWRILIGLENYTDALTNGAIRRPVVNVFIWNFVFAFGSVLFTLVIGLLLALTFNHERMRGTILYRSIYILPYAIPAGLSVLIWRGLLNTQFGQVNQFWGNFGIDPIPWLTDATWAKVALLLVNTWLGFTYMYLISTGALQSVPSDLQEAARTDGANGWQVFRKITFPLLMVSLAPLLIGSFAFNFNNFVIVEFLTQGGPPVLDAAVPVGATDILITFTYELAVSSGRGNQFGLGTAFTMMIFFVLIIISSISFRFTKRLEEIYGSL